MVGGLIQDDQIRILQQQLTQCHTGLLAAGQGRDRLIEFLLGKAKSFQDTGHFTLVAIAVLQLEVMEQVGITGHELL